jgi:hypothetical protein
LAEALVTVWAEILLIRNHRPVEVDALGSVNVNAPDALMITEVSSAPAVPDVPVFVTGAGVPRAPLTVKLNEAAVMSPTIRSVAPVAAQTLNWLLVLLAVVSQLLAVPKRMLLLPVCNVTDPTALPSIKFDPPVVILLPAACPNAVLEPPVVLALSAVEPIPVLAFPEVVTKPAKPP